MPGLKAGEVVEVRVRFEQRDGATETRETQRPVGVLKDQVKVMPNFDAPLEEFDEYT